VDHIVAINKGGPAFPPLDGLMSMCEACHNAKTNAVDHPNASGFRRALKGFDLEGNPIDGDGWTA
jgi:5-methylcytosine-specific restriction endonuclease McrA